MILILSSADDQHAIDVMKHLEQIEAPYHLLDLSKFPQNISINMHFDGQYISHLQYLQRRSQVDLSGVGAVWWRRPQHFKLHDCIKDPEHRQFAYREMDEAFTGLWQNLDCFWINAPHLDQFASRKAYQLRIAQEIGFQIPETLITNNVAEAKQFIEHLGFNQTVYKPFGGTLQTWRETRVLKKEELDKIEHVQYAPLIFQEYIPASVDLRITVVGDQIFPASIDSQSTRYPQDCRMDIGNAQIKAVELPEALERRIRMLMKVLKLHYGAIDMRLTPEGDYVFLEINPAGQWLFVEYQTQQPIAEALACLLAQEDAFATLPLETI